MNNKIYRKIYFYTFIILIASVFSTVLIVDFFADREFKKKLHEPFLNHTVLLKGLILDAYNKSDLTEEKINYYEKITDWKISYWKNKDCQLNCYESNLSIKNNIKFERLLKTNKTEVFHISKKSLIIALYIDKKNVNKGFITINIGDFPGPPSRMIKNIISFIMIMMFLALFLIPYTKYILRPFEKLNISINNVASGNFKNTVEASTKKDFFDITSAFNDMTMKIKDMIDEKERLIADVSHEIRTPLSKIRLAQELLLKEDKGNPKYINRSIIETENLDNIVNDLLDASELELNPDRYKLVNLDVKDIVNKNIDRNNLILQKRNLKINKNFIKKPMIIRVEKLLINRVFDNIFSNISKYAPENSNIDITLESENNNSLITIRDYGSGVDEKHLEKIFEPFYRTDDSRARQTGGTGLGLAIVKKIIKLHGGNIWAELTNDPQSGLVFKIRLPLIDS